ncbi:MAG: hypothetical protein HQL50_00035 [Magnetococcales bacterium]|nr:hypothetical protein [Magnetococcales bacterium]
MDNMTKCRNEQCGKSFHVTKWGPVVPGGKEKETVECPYCGTVAWSEMTSQLFQVSKLEDEKQVEK